MTFRLGLTGSIGMGKSTTANLFREAGVPVWDADAAVTELYGPTGAAGPALAAVNPRFRAADGSVDRAALKQAIAADPQTLKQIEAVVHPLVAQNREAFVAEQARAGVPLVVLDIPLLFETGAQAAMDAVLVVTAPPEVQRARVLARPGMTEALFDQLLAAQMPDADKRARADYLLETRDMDSARRMTQDIVDQLWTETDA